MATSISHDSHNIIVVGTTEEDMAAAANRMVENRRRHHRHGRTARSLGEVPLAIAGIMSDEPPGDGEQRSGGRQGRRPSAWASSRGIDPFMTLSFMALPVIPSLRITTRGVFDVSSQRYI